MNDALGDRMKMYEKAFYPEILMPQTPAFARIDGKNFHNFTKNLKKPYDVGFNKSMIELTKVLVEDCQANIGYRQSDEITLSWYMKDFKSQIPFFNGKIQKMVSVLASMATAYFADIMEEQLPEKADQFAFFDCRVWSVPNLTEAANVFLWREQDATRNSIQMAARSVYSHKECNNKDVSELQEMLFKKGINWNDYPEYFKRGTYISNFQVFKISEREQKNPDNLWPVMQTRRQLKELQLPILSTIENRSEVLYLGAEPVLKSKK